MSNNVKPPIGVSPHWYVHNKRIEELSKAITRYTTFIMEHGNTLDGADYYECIAKWADEIKMLSLIEIQLLSNDKENRNE